MRNQLLETLNKMKNIDTVDKVEIELMILQLMNPPDYEDYRKGLQKVYYNKKRK